MERCWKDPPRYSKIDEGRWKDDEKIHSIILGSSKADGKISQKTKANTEKLESLKDRIPIMKSKFPIEDLKLYSN
jgi:hypothetical protein